jgi:hypothetical protein
MRLVKELILRAWQKRKVEVTRASGRYRSQKPRRPREPALPGVDERYPAPWQTPTLDQFSPVFGYQESGVSPREVEYFSDPIGREIDAVDHIRQLLGQANHHHTSKCSKHVATEKRNVLREKPRDYVLRPNRTTRSKPDLKHTQPSFSPEVGK